MSMFSIGPDSDKRIIIVLAVIIVAGIAGVVWSLVSSDDTSADTGRVMWFKCANPEKQCGAEFSMTQSEFQEMLSKHSDEEASTVYPRADCPECGGKLTAVEMSICPKCGHRYLWGAQYKVRGLPMPIPKDPSQRQKCPKCGADYQDALREAIKAKRK